MPDKMKNNPNIRCLLQKLSFHQKEKYETSAGEPRNKNNLECGKETT